MKEAVSLHKHAFRRQSAPFVYDIQIACLGYIYTTGSELQRCDNANRAACNRDTPRLVAISLVKYVH